MEITAAVAVHPDTDFEFQKLQLADPRPDEVMVAVEAVGLCHENIGARAGALPVELPAVLGHEVAGTVVSVGVDVTKVAPGDRVVMSFNSYRRPSVCRVPSITSALIVELTIVGIVEGDSVPDEFIPELIDLHRQGKLPIDK